ncbi:GNAT family N-acetyltransferase [Spirillospora sp. CA-255316]
MSGSDVSPRVCGIEGARGIRVTLPGLECAAALARAFVKDVLGPGHPALDDVRTCVNEAFANAVEHTASGRGGQVEVSVVDEGGRVRAEVADDGAGGERPRLCDDPLAENGRGMRIIDALALDWGVRTDGDRSVVWMSFIGSAGGRGRTYDRGMDLEPRLARPEDWPVLPGIEQSGDALFAPLGIVFPPGPMVVETMIEKRAEILVAGDPPVGFAAVEEVDGAVHLEQISVHTDHVRKGIGGRLLKEVLRRAADAGSPGVSLLTFRDVPWNGPWYAAHGFEELPRERWGPGLRAHWDAEVGAGLHELGPRVVMWAAL